jgi:hypothetical protein
LGVGDFGAFFAKHWAWVSSDPGAALALAALVAGVTFVVARFFYQRTIAIKDAKISLITEQRDDYREKLGGATPAQAKERIDALEAHVQLVTGIAWPALTPGQIDQLADRFRAIAPRLMHITYENRLGRTLAEGFAAAFEKAGWTRSKGGASEGREFYCGPGGARPGLHVGAGSKKAPIVRQAIADVTGLNVVLVVPNIPGDSLWIGVGMREAGVSV